MPKKHTITTYSFDELSDKAKKKAVAILQQSESENLPTEFITEVLAEKLEDTGYPSDKISWSLSCCQGDGVAFTGRIDLDLVVPRLFKGDKAARLLELLEEGHIRIDIVSRGNYCHYRSMSLEVNFSGDDKDVALVNGLEEAILADIRSLSKDMEKIGYDQIDALTSEEAVIESAIANEMAFVKDGTLACFRGMEEEEEQEEPVTLRGGTLQDRYGVYCQHSDDKPLLTFDQWLNK